jgi:hypothetical protein
MSKTSEPTTITIDRRLLEHADGLHVKRMRSAIWLYLVLLAELGTGEAEIEIAPAALAKRMGLPEGTIRSWLGHLKKARYIEATKLNGTVRVRIKHSFPVPKPESPTLPSRAFTAAKLARALGERSEGESLERVLEEHSDAAIRKALARTLAVPSEKIRRSRTALFLYLVKRNANEENEDHPRP